MKVTLNIGLNTNDGDTLTTQEAIQEVAAAGLFIFGTEVFESDTEPTLVITAHVLYRKTNTFLGGRMAELSKKLRQDCIAVAYDDTKSGNFFGPKAKEWGPFNPAFFITRSGARLG